MKYQINEKLSTLGYTQETFTKAVKTSICGAFNFARNWKTYEGTLQDLHNHLFTSLAAFRLGIKEGSNKKSSCNEVWAIALDLDVKADLETKGCSVSYTKAFCAKHNLNYIFYLSSSGVKGQDCTPHRLVLSFSKAMSIEDAELYTKHLSMELQGKEICFDATRLWFFTVPENMDTLTMGMGVDVDTVIKPDLNALNSSLVAKKSQKLKSLLKPSEVNQQDEPLLQKLNKGLVSYALSLGLQEFHDVLGIDITIQDSKRSCEQRSDSDLPTLVERFDVRPPASDSFDRVDCNLTSDGILLFYDRRDGVNGFTGSFIQWLIKCELGSSHKATYDEQLAKAKQLYDIFNLEWPIVLPKSSFEFWQCYLKENADILMYITKGAFWCLHTGTHWVKLSKSDQLNHVSDWCLNYYGVASTKHLDAVKNTLRNITARTPGLKIKERPPRDRHLFGFADGVWDTENKEFLEHSPDNYTWACHNYNWLDYQDIEKGRIAKDALMEIIKTVVVGDDDKHQAFLNSLILYSNASLYKSNCAIWMYGDGGAGKSTIQQDYLGKMLGYAARGGRVVDVKAKTIFDSPHSMGMLLDGTALSFSEFSMPRDKDCSILKDIIAPDGINGVSDMGDSLGCAIEINNKYEQPYTDFGYFDVIISSQKKSNMVDISDSGWARRFFYVNFKKVEKSEKDLPFEFVNQNLRYLFTYFLNSDCAYILQQFKDYIEGNKSEELKTIQVENNVAAQYLVEHLEESEDLIPVSQIWSDFQRRKEDYGVSLSLNTWRERLKSALNAFGTTDKHKQIHVIGRHYYIYYQLYSPISESAGNGNGHTNGNGHKKETQFSFDT